MSPENDTPQHDDEPTPEALSATEADENPKTHTEVPNRDESDETMDLAVGTRVRIQRDETKHPSRGIWPQFRGRIGTIVEINDAGKGSTEYGVSFTKAHGNDAWFKSHELVSMSGGAK